MNEWAKVLQIMWTELEAEYAAAAELGADKLRVLESVAERAVAA